MNLTNAEINNYLAKLNAWQSDGKKINKSYKFKNFAQSLAFVNKIGQLAELAKHHPDIEFGWGYVRVSLTTHDENGVTEKDFNLAEEIDNNLL